MNDNRKYRAPPLAITEGMLEAGLKLLETMVDAADDHGDRELVGGIFAEMWRIYWQEIHAVALKKQKGSPIVALQTFQPLSPRKLILPPG